MVTLRLRADKQKDVERAAELLRAGAIVAFPTETVYGLGARWDNPDAIAELARVKQRPKDKKFTLLIASPEEAACYGELGGLGWVLARAFWPGPLTLVIPDGRGGGVGLRCPDCPAALELVRLVGTAVAAPSANVSGQPPATTAAQVLAAFDGEIAAVLDGGPSPLGVSSTVVSVLGGTAKVLRPGAIPEERLRAVLAGSQGC